MAENAEKTRLISFLNANPKVPLVDIIDHRGYTLLHAACFKNHEFVVSALIEKAKEEITRQGMKEWINHKTDEDGFAALHFASFRGNLTIINLLLNNGADINIKNNYGINVLHVASQGDQPISLLFFKEAGMDLKSRDNRGSTPLHWACYSKSEIALCYLLSWQTDFDDTDIEGYTPLHLAVKSVEQLRSTRPVRSLLIRGASRLAKDNEGRTPADLADNITNVSHRIEL